MKRLVMLTVTVSVAVALAVSGTAAATPPGQTAEFPTPTGNSQPLDMVAAPDGNMWFTENAGDKIGQINPFTHAIAEFSLPTAFADPAGMTVGPDGNLWFTEAATDKIGEINPFTHGIADFPIPTAFSDPIDIVAGPDGNLWFTEAGGDNVGRINPATHVITEFPVPTTNSQPFGIAAGPDGDIWFTEKNANKIAYFNPATPGTMTELTVPTPSSQPNDIADGPNSSMWFTESDGSVNKIGLIDPATHTITGDFAAAGQPQVIVAGADGNMWFTEKATDKVAFINPVTKAVTEFPTPTAHSAPIGIAPGADGNLWVAESGTFTTPGPSQIAVVGDGAPAASAAAPSVAGPAQPGGVVTCAGATWSTWAGLQPSLGAHGWDGYQWLLDGSPVAGATAPSLTVPAADVGHHLSCRVTVTYPLLETTADAASAGALVYPDLGAALGAVTTTGARVTLTLSCAGLPGQTCSGPITLTSHVTRQGKTVVGVAAKAKKRKHRHKSKPKPRKVTTVQTVGSGGYSVAAGQSTTVAITLNSTGRSLLSQRYRLPVTLAIGGTSPATQMPTFRYGVIRSPVVYTWVFGPRGTTAQQLTVTGVPSGGKVQVTCRGGGCPFGKRSFKPRRGRVNLAPAFKRHHLRSGATVQIAVTAVDQVGRVTIFTIHRTSAPSSVRRCLPPGARGPQRCAT